ncbi:hypothetical protein ACVDG5_011375 [Mesorhizobium sp. ORM6]
MSPDGGDASEMREFDIETKSFIEGGFRAPASKSGFGWLDKDTVIVSAAFEEADKTESGYPRVVKLWKRGTKLEEATPIFEAQKRISPSVPASSSMARNVICFWRERSTSSHRTVSCAFRPVKTGAFRCPTT